MSDGSNDGDRDEIWDERYRKQAIQKQLDELSALKGENERLKAILDGMGHHIQYKDATRQACWPDCPRCAYEKMKGEGK